VVVPQSRLLATVVVLDGLLDHVDGATVDRASARAIDAGGRGVGCSTAVVTARLRREQRRFRAMTTTNMTERQITCSERSIPPMSPGPCSPSER
jgi:hypothetical protein